MYTPIRALCIEVNFCFFGDHAQTDRLDVKVDSMRKDFLALKDVAA